MSSWQESPGNVRNQVGMCLRDIAMNIEQADMVGTGNFTMFLETVAWPMIPKVHDQITNLVKDTDELWLDERDETGTLVFRKLNERMRVVLKALTERNLYGFDAMEVGDASGLAVNE